MVGLRCPHDDAEAGACTTLIDRAMLVDTLHAPPELVAKWARFLEMRTQEHFRECPQCSAPHTAGPPEDGSNQLRCGECAAEFCYAHGNAHVGMSCCAYERTQRRNERATLAEVNKHARRCPRCKTPVIKAGGCNHMTCGNEECRADFCWLCGRDITNSVDVHYAPFNMLGCPGLQMEDNLRGNTSSCGCTSLLWLLRIALVVPVRAVGLQPHTHDKHVHMPHAT